MTGYRQAVRLFRLRYVLGAVLRHNGRVASAAREIGLQDKYVWMVLRNGGISSAQIREMLVNRELLNAGLPPRKPVASVSAAGEIRRTA